LGFLKRGTSSFFPDREMTFVEALNNYNLCLAAVEGDGRARIETPESKLPPGGYAAVVESFARYYVGVAKEANKDALYEHLKSGLAIFALAVPDWMLRITERERDRAAGEACDGGIVAAAELANNLISAICDVQLAWGEAAFEARVVELQGGWES